MFSSICIQIAAWADSVAPAVEKISRYVQDVNSLPSAYSLLHLLQIVLDYRERKVAQPNVQSSTKTMITVFIFLDAYRLPHRQIQTI